MSVVWPTDGGRGDKVSDPAPVLLIDLSSDAYHASEAWGSHSLKAMRKGPPARVMWERENRRESDAMAFGTAVHMAVFQPTLYAETYVAKPDGMSFATKDGKAWRDAHAGRHILTYVEALTVDRMQLALSAKSRVGEALTRATHQEASIFWSDALWANRARRGQTAWMRGTSTT